MNKDNNNELSSLLTHLWMVSNQSLVLIHYYFKFLGNVIIHTINRAISVIQTHRCCPLIFNWANNSQCTLIKKLKCQLVILLLYNVRVITLKFQFIFLFNTLAINHNLMQWFVNLGSININDYNLTLIIFNYHQNYLSSNSRRRQQFMSRLNKN